MIKRGRTPLDYEYGRYFPGEAGKRRQKDLEKSYMTERNIQGLSEKVFLRLEAPSEEEHVSDQMRIRQGLEEKGYRDIRFSLAALRTLYPLCREAGWEITVTLVHEEQGILITAVEAGDRTREHYGLAVDYGSTTILMQIVDMNTGEVLAEESETNGQAAYGADILTRITYGMEKPEHKRELHQATVETFHRLLEKLTEKTGIQAGACPVMVISGNTTMVHFFLELDAWTVFSSPYAPVTTEPGFFRGRELGLDFAGEVFFMPGISNYVGGDIVSGLLLMDFYRKDEIGLFFDIGTNGELVIGNREWLLAGAGAAGPALEGDISRYGIRAREGAIDTVRIEDGKLSFTTIGGMKPVGICGSGIIDLLAEMRLNGWTDIAGNLDPQASERIVYFEDEGEYGAVYATAEESGIGEPLYFSQTDIKQYIDTKAAAHTMLDCLLESAGCTEEDIGHYYLSGAFCAHGNLESAITVGIFPDVPLERYTALRNSSLDGARTLLLDRNRMEDIRYLRENVFSVQFASMPDFLIRMQAAKFIPHTDMEKYPTVKRKLEEKGRKHM